MTTTRPGLYPLHDLLGLNVIQPENSLFMQSGYPVGLPVPSADHNGKFGRSGLWHQYLDLNGIRNADWLDTVVTQTLSATTLSYSLGGNVLAGGATVAARGVHLVGGTRIETDAAFLNPVGGRQGDPLIYTGATVPGRIWIYASETGAVRYDSVAAGVADSPAVGEVTLVGVRIDALGDVVDGSLAPTIPLPAQRLAIATPLEVEGGATFQADLAMGGNNVTGAALVACSTVNTDEVNITVLSYHSVRGSTQYGSSNTMIYRWTSVVDNSGTDIVYTDSGANGGSWAILVAGIYTVSMSLDAGHAGYVAIKKAASLSNTFDETSIMVAGESAAGITMSLSWTGFCAVGSDIWIASNSAVNPTGVPVNNHRCSVTRVR